MFSISFIKIIIDQPFGAFEIHQTDNILKNFIKLKKIAWNLSGAKGYSSAFLKRPSG